MASIRLLLGKTRLRRRNALPESLLEATDAIGRPLVAHLVGSQAHKGALERGPLARDGVGFAPEVYVLEGLVLDLYARWGPGRALLSRRALAIVAELAADDVAAVAPWLAELGGTEADDGGRRRALGRALCELHEAWIHAARPTLGPIPHAPELAEVLRALATRVRLLPGHVSAADATHAVLRQLQAPPPGLRRWLGRHQAVIVDGLLDPSPLERQVLVALLRGWRDAGSEVIVGLETGRDLGGAEVGAFFGYDDADDVAVALKPFAATRGLRRMLFDELVASGEATVHLATEHGLHEVEPGAVPGPVGRLDLSDLVYAGPTATLDHGGALGDAPLRGRVAILRCTDTDEEVLAVARAVKQALLDGVPPARCAIGVADLQGYAPALGAALDAHGIAWLARSGVALCRAPVARVVLRVARLALQGAPAPDLAALLTSDLVSVPCSTAARRLPGWLRAAGVRQGSPLSWEPTLRAWLRAPDRRDERDALDLDACLTALEQAAAPILELDRAREPAAWRATLLRALAVLGLPGAREDDPALAAATRRAWGAVLRQIDELVADLEQIDPGPWPAASLAGHLADALRRGSYQPAPGARDRVIVVQADELPGVIDGAGCSHGWLVGLTRGAFPAPAATSWLVPPSTLRGLQTTDPIAVARYSLLALLRAALADDAGPHVTLTWPTSREGRPTAPSPVLEDLLAVPLPLGPGGAARLVADTLVTAPEAPPRPLAWADALRAAATAPSWDVLLSPPQAAAVARRRALVASRALDAPGPFDGVLDHPPAMRDTLSVTRLETYLRCPARFGFDAELGLRAPPTWDPDIPAADRGRILHGILEAFYTDRGMQAVAGEDPQVIGPRLHAIAVEHLQALDRPGIDPALADALRERWLDGLIDRRAAGLLRVWLDDELRADNPLRPVAVEVRVRLPLGGVVLEGTIDRYDRVSHTGDLVITDYKTGRAPAGRAIARGLALQPIAYTAALAAERPEARLAFAYVELRRADDVRRRGWVGEPEVLAELLPPWEARRAVGADVFLRDALIDHAAAAVGRMARGLFHTTLAETTEVGCAWCPHRRICRHDPARAARIEASEGDWQRPFDDPLGEGA